MDNKKFPHGDDLKRLQSLYHQGRIHTSPAKDYDDSFMIDFAIEKQAILVTRDYYRDFEPKKAGDFTKQYIESHSLSYLFCGDDFRPSPDFKCPPYYELPEN